MNNTMKTKAIFFGSFNPFHIGHLNILRKAENTFGKGNVIIAMGINPDKFNSVEERDAYIEDKEGDALILSKKIECEVITYNKFMHQVVETYEGLGYNVVIIRGIRNGTDLDYETTQMRYVSEFKKDINVVYITCDKEFEHISSSAIKKIMSFNGGYEMGLKYLV